MFVCSLDCQIICLEVLHRVCLCQFVCVRKDRKTVKVCFADRNDNTQTSKVVEGCHYSIPQLLFVCYENIVLLICLSEVG